MAKENVGMYVIKMNYLSLPENKVVKQVSLVQKQKVLRNCEGD